MGCDRQPVRNRSSKVSKGVWLGIRGAVNLRPPTRMLSETRLEPGGFVARIHWKSPSVPAAGVYLGSRFLSLQA